ncbi:MAG: IS1634 family transposase [Burkholderiales bacterium]
MFVREKRIGAYSYLYLVESVREGGRVKQRVIKNLGRKDAVLASGELDRLARSLSKLAQRSLVLSLLDEGRAPHPAARRFGPALLFERLWVETGCRAVMEELLAERRFEFAVERAVFLTVLHRLMMSGSDRAAERWREDYRIDGTQDLDLHHLYRAMAWLGEELGEPAPAGALAPRATKDLIEERLFARRRDLFSELSVVFMDTTSLYFEGAGGDSLGAYGFSKDHRPDRKQMVVAAVLDGQGHPLCCELMPGNTSDVAVLRPLVRRLQQRFGIGRVCIVADRGMISAATIAALEAAGFDYILGVRERSDPLVRRVVLVDDRPLTPLVLTRKRRQVQYGAKEVIVDGRRYIVCRNENQAQADAADRQRIVEGLQRQLAKGERTLVANMGYRRYLKAGGPQRLVVDEAKLADEAMFDGIFVLRTNTTLDPLQAMLRYKDLWTVEQLFRSAKSLLETRPIFHQRDETIRGHVFCSFLALVLRKALEDRLAAHGLKLEWADVLRDLDRLQELELDQDGKRFCLRTPVTGVAGKLFQAVGVALPPNIRALSPQTHAAEAPKL